MTDAPSLTHLSAHGGVHMVDIANKPDTTRTAVAAGRVLLGEEVFHLVQGGKVRKGDVLTVAQIAGILGAKQTSKLLPLCHDVHINGVEVELDLDEEDFAIDVRAYVKTVGPTGVEMEALTAVSIAALTIYDMCKSAAKGIRITDVHLLAKTGGQSGDYLKGDNA